MLLQKCNEFLIILLSGKRLLFLCITFFGFIFSISCNENDRLQQTLILSGDNRIELENVLKHYENKGDLEKLAAAKFLIENLRGYNAHQITVWQNNHEKLNLNFFKLNDKETVIKHIDSIKQHKQLFPIKEVEFDHETVSANYLINNIEQSFLAWKNYPWSKNIDFNIFCEYILPYRARFEPIERYRMKFMKEYRWINDSIDHKHDPLYVCNLINNDLSKKFNYSEIALVGDKNQGVSEILTNKKGSCEDLTVLATCAMRSMGLPVTIDYTPHWAYRTGRHSWNVLIDGSGFARHFGGAEQSIGTHRIGNEYLSFAKMAKVFRRTFSVQSNSLIFDVKKGESVPNLFLNPNSKDVTKEYLEVSDVQHKLSNIPDDTYHAYICVYNSKWKPIFWSSISKKGYVKFKDMGRDILYIIMYYVDENFKPASAPFIVKNNGDIKYYNINYSKKRNINLSKYNRFEFGKLKAFTPGKRYRVYYWDKRWIPTNWMKADTTILTYTNIPQDGIYKFESNDPNIESNRYRPFTINSDNSQIFW